jgi:hypothetical protein
MPADFFIGMLDSIKPDPESSLLEPDGFLNEVVKMILSRMIAHPDGRIGGFAGESPDGDISYELVYFEHKVGHQIHFDVRADFIDEPIKAFIQRGFSPLKGQRQITP